MNKCKRFLALFLVLCLTFSVAPLSAFAAEGDPAGEATVAPTEAETEAPTEASAEAATEVPTETTEPQGEPAQSEEPGVMDEEPAEEDPDDGETALSLEDVYVTSSAQVPYTGEFLKIVHLDCGRKYFTVNWVKSLIDEMAKDGYTHLELAFGNDGLRFLLDDMSVTVGDITYSSESVKTGIQNGNKAYYNAGANNEWSEADMDEIISYATGKGVGIIPLLNTPGHMDAIIDAMEYVEISNPAFAPSGYSASSRTVDLENTEAVAFTQALVEKYVNYFKGKGCTLFHLGTDEYANDILINYSGMGFGYLQTQGTYDLFVKYVNSLASIVSNAGMTPMAFNDGVYYNGVTTDSFNSDILITYWSNGWGNYAPASAEFLASRGHQLVNTHGDFYYVLGKSDNFDNGSGYAGNWDNKKFPGTTFTEDKAGAMFCIWCDYPGAETEDQITQKVINTGILSALSEKMGHEKTVELSTVTCKDHQISVTAPGLTSLNCTRVENPAYSEDGAVVVVGYNITPYADETAYTGSGTVEIAVPEEVQGLNSIRIYDAKYEKVVPSAVADGKITFTASHFSEYDIIGQNVEVTKEKTITVSVGQTLTDIIEGGSYSPDEKDLNTAIATVSAEYTQTSADKEVREVTAITSGKQYLIVNTRAEKLLTGEISYYGDNAGLALNGELSPESTALWTITSSGSGYTIQNSSNRYLTIGYNTASVSGSSASLSLIYTNGTWTIAQSSQYGYYTYYLNDFGNQGSTAAGWSDNTAAIDAGSQWKIYEVVETGAVNGTTVTFTGVAVGTTYVIVGDTRYTINVIAEDLSKVTPLTVEYWITNRQVTADGAISGTIAANAEGVYSEGGALFSDLVPAYGTHDSNTMVFWKGTRLASDNKQTATSGVDMTMSGTDFTYVRYWNSSWAYSADGENWTGVASGDQIVAYYLQWTEVTDEVATQVVDWGVVPHTDYNSTNFVLVDYAVKYESGDRTPTSFPVTSRTMAFHCDPHDTTTVHHSGSSYEWYNYYRDIGLIKAENTDEYEVYMITVTMTSDLQTGEVTENANTATGYEYGGTEYVVWAATQADLDGSGLGAYSSISNKYGHSIGGEAKVPGLEIFNRHGALITYYVRAKVTEDSLTVHYIDQIANQEFYNYSIAVATGTTFDEGIALADPWKGALENGTVTNSLGKTQTVSADLSTMPAIGAQYRYSEYQCVRVERSEDGKHVYLYYTFNNTHSFVIDFGLSLNITAADIDTSGLTFVSVTGAQYGEAKISDGGVLIYTPNLILRETEVLQLTLSDGNDNLTHQIYIYPATTVHYEETFIDFGNGTSAVSGRTQDKEKLDSKINNFGYDPSNNGMNQASNNSEHELNTIGEAGTFTFTGTGIDVYANCAETTGYVAVQIADANGAIEKVFMVDTAVGTGVTNATGGQTGSFYSLPIVSYQGLDHGEHTVTIRKIMDTDPVKIDGFRVYNTIADSSIFEKDSEANPSFVELRDLVLTASSTGSGSIDDLVAGVKTQVYEDVGTLTGAIVVADGNKVTSENLTDLLNNGPKNELYLVPGSAVTFTLAEGVTAQIGMKTVQGESVTVLYNDENKTIASSTDMFYGNPAIGSVTITNPENSGGILSITLLKYWGAASSANLLAEVSDEQIGFALRSLNLVAEETDPVDPTDPVTPVEPPVDPEVPVEPEITYADATLTVGLVDYTGKEVASAVLTKNGVAGEPTAFTAQEILAAVAEQMPEKYALVDESAVTDMDGAYGVGRATTVQVGKVATLKITYVNLFGRKIGTVTITRVQTSAGTCQISASEIRGSAPKGRAVWLTPVRVPFGSEMSIIVSSF